MECSNNANEPASPEAGVSLNGDTPVALSQWTGEVGMTKRELFCLHLKVADTGDPYLDHLIQLSLDREAQSRRNRS